MKKKPTLRERKTLFEQNKRNRLRLLKIKALRESNKKNEEGINRILGGLPK